MIEQHIPDELPNDRSDTRSDARVDDRSAPRPQHRMVQHIGVQILGDAFRPGLRERLLESPGPDDFDQMLCG